jgi:hypothetical protein
MELFPLAGVPFSLFPAVMWLLGAGLDEYD